MVKEWWGWPGVIADRYSHIPDDDQRGPGTKLSESGPHTSPLDSQPDVPVFHTAVCLDKKNKDVQDLTDARGIYGFKGATLQPVPTESVLSFKKEYVFSRRNCAGPEHSQISTYVTDLSRLLLTR